MQKNFYFQPNAPLAVQKLLKILTKLRKNLMQLKDVLAKDMNVKKLQLKK